MCVKFVIFFTGWEEKQMDNILERRLANTCRILSDKGYDKAVIGDPTAIYYLTGIHIIPYDRYYGLVLDAEKQSAVMVNPSVDTGCMRGAVPEITYLDEDGPLEAIRSAVGACSVLAVEKRYFSIAHGEMFAQLGAGSMTDLGDAVDLLRMHKDEQEIEYMQFAAKIVDEALAYVKPRIKPGMTETELYMMLFTFMSRYPGFSSDEIIIYVLGGANSANPHGVTADYAFRYGDVVLMDFCAYYKYYWSDITRCMFIGEADPRLAEIYEITLQANLAAIARVRPGVKAREIDDAARDYIAAAGYGEQFLHRTGHGLGLSVHEEPYITSINELVLEEGMTFTIEPGIYLEGIGGIRIEDDILVTKDGCRILTGYPKSLAENIIPFKK